MDENARRDWVRWENAGALLLLAAAPVAGVFVALFLIARATT